MRDYLSLDGDASGTQRIYTGSGRECPTSSEIDGLYCLAPKGACSRGVQAGCERRLSPKSRLCGGQSAGGCSRSECVDRVCMNLVNLNLVVSPGSPFIASRGDRDLHE